MNVILIGGFTVRWATPPERLSDQSSVVVALVAEDREALRTQPLTKDSGMSWSIKGENIPVPLRGEALKLEVKYRNPGQFESTIGCVELDSDELFARGLRGDITASFILPTTQQNIAAEMEVDFLLDLDEGSDSDSDGDVSGDGGLTTELDHEYSLAIQLQDTDPDKWFFLMSIGAQYYEHFMNHDDMLSLAKAFSPFEKAIGLVLDITPPQADQQQFIRDKTQMYVAGITQFVENISQSNTMDIDLLSGMFRRTSAIYIMLHDRFGNREDLSEAISLCELASAMVPDHHPDTPTHLRRRGVALTLRFRSSGDVRDINESIASLQDSVNLASESDPDLPDRLTNLGTSFVLRAEHLHSLQDVNKAIAAHTRALNLREDYTLLLNLATAILLRFIFQRDLADAEAAVVTLERATRLVPEGHPELRRCLGNLGVAYHNRFEALHRLEDIDNAVATQQRAFRIMESGGDDSPERATHIASLGNAYLSRAETLNDVQDSELAVETLKRSVELTPPDLPHLQKRRHNLGRAYAKRYELLQDSSDGDLAVVELDASLGLLPEGHADQPAVLLGLAQALLVRFGVSKKSEDIERAISLCSSALEALGPRDYRRRSVLITLAASYTSRFDSERDPHDLDEAIQRSQEVVDDTATGREDTYMQCAAMQLADAVKRRFELNHSSDDLDVAIANYRIAATVSNGVPWSSFVAAKYWARAAKTRGDSSAVLQAYGVAIDLLPRAAWIGHAIANRHAQLASLGSSLTSEAVAAAIAQGEHCLAVEWLDQARVIVWGQQLKFRSSFDELRIVAPALAAQLDRVSRALDTAGSRDIAPTTDFLGTARLEDAAQEGRRTAIEWQRWQEQLQHLAALTDVLESIGSFARVVTDTESPAQIQRRRAEEWDRLVAQARTIPGYEDFLRPRTFSQISEALNYSPVVIVNTDEYRCDALVLMEGLDDVIHIPLGMFTRDDAQRLQRGLFKLLSDSNLRQRTTRAAEIVPIDSAVSIGSILAELWREVVKPILESLAFSVADRDDLKRIWWCPTGPLTSLPLHAAGDYTIDEPGAKLSDFAISSYTPTLTPFTHPSPPSTGGFHGILCVSQAATLPAADVEASMISDLARGYSIDCCSLRDDVGTVQAVLDGLEHYGWVHLACHGVQDIVEPTKSRFVLHDGPLALLEIIASSFKHADFAFLSACQTAMGADDLPEEAAHLAMGMLAAGFKSVIGTMWSIQDADALAVAEQVYNSLLSNSAKLDSSRAAVALHHAVRVLREREQDHDKSFSWVPFIHVGW